MYSPADLPSSSRAAPAKKRRLSAQTGSSSRAAPIGLPTLRDSICASSSALSSRICASLSKSSARSPGVESSHSGSACFAASTARSTSSAPQRGTAAIVSPVAGFSTSIVAPSAASVHAPPMNTFCCETTVLMWPPSRSFVSEDARLTGQALGDDDGDDRHQDHRESDDVDDGKLLTLAQVVEDEDRDRRLRACRERGHDHLVEREGEREQAAGDERSRDHRPRHVAKGLPAVGPEVHRR